MANSLTNKGWEQIFNELDISNKLLSNNFFKISANQIKSISKREPRLMCKFDDRVSRPQIFRDHDLTIIPIKNGEYVLVKADGYYDLPKINDSIEYLEWPFKKRLQTLPKEPRSESQVIDLAYATGILHHFLHEDNLTLTIRGRLRTLPFRMQIVSSNQNKEFFSIDGVQVEVDAGYESDTKIYLIEAKMGERDDFHIRQLYYPYRMWLEEGVSKEVIPIFINYANEVVSISQYKFNDKENYSSIYLNKSINYSFELNPLTLSIPHIINEIQVSKNEPLNIPFPQANDLRKVRDTIDLVSINYNTSQSISDFWLVDKRQGDYYCNAAKFLGFLDRKNSKWVLTPQGEKFVHLENTKRNKLLIEKILCHPVFYSTMIEMLSSGDSFDINTIKPIVAAHTELSTNTVKRRIGTVNSWCKYLLNNFP